MPHGNVTQDRVTRRLRIWIALRILPRDWSAAGPRLGPPDLTIRIHPVSEISPDEIRKAIRRRRYE